MKKYFPILAMTAVMLMLSGCKLNPWANDNPVNDKVDIPEGCAGYITANGSIRWDQIPGEPTCPLTTTVIPADQPATPASPTDEVTPTETPTATVPTPTPAAPPVATPSTDEWVAFESEGGIPYSGDAINVDVAPDELEVITAGPVTVNGITLPGGYDRGSVVIFLPGAEVVHYTASGVIPGSNWHASYRPQSDPTVESTWMSLADFTVANMFGAPNCSPGTGCLTIDVIVMGPSGFVAQWAMSL